MERLAKVITKAVFDQRGIIKRLEYHFLVFWTHWSRFHKHLSIVNTYIYTFEYNREAQAIGSWTKEM